MVKIAIASRLKEKDKFLTGDNFTALDINAFLWLSLMSPLGLLTASYPEMEKWLRLCQTETVIERAMKNIEAGQSRKTLTEKLPQKRGTWSQEKVNIKFDGVANY